MAYTTGRLRPTLVPLSGWVEILLVKVHERVEKSVISVYKRTIKGLTVASYKTLAVMQTFAQHRVKKTDCFLVAESLM